MTIFTRERVQWLHDAASEFADTKLKMTMNPEEVLILTRMLLTAMQQEPVAWSTWDARTGKLSLYHLIDDVNAALSGNQYLEIVPFYTAPPAPVVPEAMQQEPVSFDVLNETVAEVTGGNLHSWNFALYKGHHQVPFINYNSLSRIVEKFRVAPQPASVVPDEIDVNDPALDTRRRWMAEGWNRCRAAMFQLGIAPHKLGNDL
ncbi:TPA: hypothetical protein N3J09_000865 [Salmonella enterica subsp. enterica serovar Panama]|nr:hypothetical protein [Salmonella enterica]HCM4642376.1 hypothetical protein [Salmonella enterica subsp. enterica serovar Panama]